MTGRLAATRRGTEPDFHCVELEIPEAESDLVGKWWKKPVEKMDFCWFLHGLYWLNDGFCNGLMMVYSCRCLYSDHTWDYQVQSGLLRLMIGKL